MTWLLLLVACGDDAAPLRDAGGSDAGRDASTVDSAVPDAALDAAIDAAVRDAGATCGELPAAPAEPIEPVPGELYYAQLGLGGFALGEAAILVAPDGTAVVIDAGNDSHDDDVADALDEITGGTAIAAAIVTHYHADHGDGLAPLLERVSLAGPIVHRGFTDLTEAANPNTVQSICEAIAAGASDGAICSAASAAPCDPGDWSGTYPATACSFDGDLALGGATIDVLAANGRIGSESFETVEPIQTTDSNGENARSLVMLVSFGAFRMLLAGDLTGGGSDTNDLESFYASRFGASIDERGVDVLHAGHHGRDTSTNPTWVARLLPSDGRSRNAIMGVSTAHLGSPHDVVLSNLLDGDRLNDGRAWTTTVSAGGATHAGLVDAGGGRIVIATIEGGAAYVVQALDGATVIESRVFRSVHACD